MIVLGSHGIAYTPVTIPTDSATESKLKVVRDATRSLFWLITGKTGSSLNNKYAPMVLERDEMYPNSDRIANLSSNKNTANPN